MGKNRFWTKRESKKMKQEAINNYIDSEISKTKKGE